MSLHPEVVPLDSHFSYKETGRKEFILSSTVEVGSTRTEVTEVGKRTGLSNDDGRFNM